MNKINLFLGAFIFSLLMTSSVLAFSLVSLGNPFHDNRVGLSEFSNYQGDIIAIPGKGGLDIPVPCLRICGRYLPEGIIINCEWASCVTDCVSGVDVEVPDYVAADCGDLEA